MSEYLSDYAIDISEVDMNIVMSHINYINEHENIKARFIDKLHNNDIYKVRHNLCKKNGDMFANMIVPMPAISRNGNFIMSNDERFIITEDGYPCIVESCTGLFLDQIPSYVRSIYDMSLNRFISFWGNKISYKIDSKYSFWLMLKIKYLFDD